MNCKTCQSLKGEISLAPGPVILDGTYWQVEHMYPVSIQGWLVVILKRHVEALHDLTSEEWDELHTIQQKIIKLLHEKLNTQKEYSMCFAEKEGFNHIHFHVVAISKDLPAEFRGPGIFGLTKQKPLPEHEIADFSQELNEKLS